MYVALLHLKRSLRDLQHARTFYPLPILTILSTHLFPQPLFAKSISENPIVTRCLPQSPCLKFPSELIDWDRGLQKTLEMRSETDHSWLKGLLWLTESPLGIALTIFLILFMICLFLKPPQVSLRKIKYTALSCVAILGISDFTSSTLKEFFGRLKPHVEFYNPSYTPALSFPSNHAFNTSVLVAMGLFFIYHSQSKAPWNKYLISTFLFSVLFGIALSRVVVGQHYPLDVISGILMGGIFSLLIYFISKPIRSSKFWRSL